MTLELLETFAKNAILLLAAGVLWDLLPLRPRRASGSRQVLVGAMLGGVAIAVMSIPWQLEPGVQFDARTVLLSLAGLFFGTLPTVVAAVVAAAWRLAVGGAGAWTGVGTIVVSAALGLIAARRWRGRLADLGWRELLGFGLVVHIAVILVFLTLPALLRGEVARRVDLPVLLVMPAGTAILGRLLARIQLSRVAVATLRERERRFRKMVERGWDIIALVGEDMTVAFVSDSVTRVLGYDGEYVVGRRLGELVHGGDQAALEATVAAVMAAPGSSQLITMRKRHRDGHWRWLDVALTNLLDDPDVAALVVNARDITARQQAKAALQASEVQLERAQQIAGLGSWAFDFVHDVVSASAETRRIYGIEKESLTIAEAKAIPLPRYRPRLDAALADLIAGRRPYDIEFEIQRSSDGAIVHIHSLAEYDAQRQVVFGTLQNITDRKRAEAALRESEARFKATFDQAAVGIAHLDLDGRWLRVNDRLCAIVGYTREELLQLTFADVTHPDDLAEDQARASRLLANELASYTMEKRYIRKDGSVVWVDLTGSIVRDDAGQPSYFIGVLVDITARKLAETERDRIEGELRQAQKMEAVGRLAGGVAHDFNNMLNVILGYAELVLAETPAASRLRTYVEGIHRAGRRSADLTRQLLAFSRKQITEPQVLDLNTEIAEQIPLMKRLIGEDVTLTFRPSPDLWRLRADPSQIDQILANLIVNARDAIANVGTITVETANFELDETYRHHNMVAAPGSYVMFAVTDDGSGMDRDTAERIFEPFFTTKAEGVGTGLGLAMVYGIVQQNRGFIHTYSEKDQGTSLKIYLPRYVGADAPDIETREMASPVGDETVLIVEDESLLLEVARSALARFGYAVLGATSPEEACTIASTHDGPIALLLTDVVMPQMNGKELRQRIEAMRPDIRTLFMSGYTANSIVHHGVLDEGIHFIHKPFTLNALATKVRAVLDGSD